MSSGSPVYGGRRVPGSRVQTVDAEDVVLDGQDVGGDEPGLARKSIDGRRAHDRAHRRRRLFGKAVRQADHGAAEYRKRSIGSSSAFPLNASAAFSSTTMTAPSGREDPARPSEHLDRSTHVVQGLENDDEVEWLGDRQAGGVHELECDSIVEVRVAGVSPCRVDRCVVRVDANHPDRTDRRSRGRSTASPRHSPDQPRVPTARRSGADGCPGSTRATPARRPTGRAAGSPRPAPAACRPRTDPRTRRRRSGMHRAGPASHRRWRRCNEP